MHETKTLDRVEFIAKNFNVFPDEEIDNIEKSIDSDELRSERISIRNEIVGLILFPNAIDKERYTKQVYVSYSTFSKILNSDPTNNKSFTQWMMNIFVGLIKNQKLEDAKRFITEDLSVASECITLFEQNKRKKLFKKLCNGSYSLKYINDPSDINQYKTLSDLYNAVDPFIIKDMSALERTISKFVELGEAEIPVKDRYYTLYIPLTSKASEIFNNFTNWCTAKTNNGMHAHYVNMKRPDGANSKLYIIIDNDVFKGKSDNLYQLHVESKQFMYKNDTKVKSAYHEIFNKSIGLQNYFWEEFMPLARINKTKQINNNSYLDYLCSFGLSDALFEIINADTPTIRYLNKDIPVIPSLVRFKNLDQVIICDSNVYEIDENAFLNENITILSLSNNKITEIPKSIGNLKNLRLLNLIDNKIKLIPEEIKFLDKSNGGSLFRISINENDIGKENYKRLKKLLPNVIFNG